jgi:hypothetical protein
MKTQPKTKINAETPAAINFVVKAKDLPLYNKEEKFYVVGIMRSKKNSFLASVSILFAEETESFGEAAVFMSKERAMSAANFVSKHFFRKCKVKVLAISWKTIANENI